MSWFILALICILGWGFADLFYKKSSDSDDGQSHLKIAVWVGLVMGAAAFCFMPFSETAFSAEGLLVSAIRYSPASLCYIISMVVGYAGLRYLELSIVSPVQNASGALSVCCMIVYFVLKGKISSFSDAFSPLELIGTVFIAAGMLALAIVEQRLSRSSATAEDRRHMSGALALIFPFLYCVFDTLGTAADGIILDEETGLGLGEIDVIIVYGLTFMLAGLCAWIYMFIKNKKPYNVFARGELTKGAAAVCEEFGQVFYVYAMAAKPLLAAPMVASYCIVSVLLSRVLLKEKLTVSQYICVVAVVAGIVMLGTA